VFESGVMVLQLQSHSEEAIVIETEEAVCEFSTEYILLSAVLVQSHRHLHMFLHGNLVTLNHCNHRDFSITAMMGVLCTIECYNIMLWSYNCA